MADEHRHETQHQWLAHPALARIVQGVALLAPLTLAVTASGMLARWLPPATTTPGAVGRWLFLCGVSTVVLLVVDRFARRLLPLAALLRLALVFPGGAPSRYRLARSVATTRQLEAEIQAAREVGIVGDREQAAEKVLQLVAALSVHDRATRGHAERVRIFTDMIAEEMGLDEDAIARLRWASLLHDIGKIFVHPDILNKPGTPTEQEWAILRTHPLEGARLAAPLEEWLGSWSLTIEQHHERWDGGGYPFGLSGRDISLGARIVAVADAFDVMTSARSYKRPMTATAARTDLAKCAGSQFDPRVVRAFLSLSLSRVRWAVGPLAWLLNLPMVRLVPLQSVTPASAAMPSGMSSMAAVTTTAVAASSMGVASLPALSALDFSDDRGVPAATADAYADVDEFAVPDRTEVVRPRDHRAAQDDDLETTLAAQVRALSSLAPADTKASEPEGQPDTDPGRRTPADAADTPPTASTGPGAGDAPPAPEGAGPGAGDAPPAPEGAGPDAGDAPPAPEGAGPGAGDAPPAPEGAGPGAGDAPPRPDGAAPVDAGSRPTASPVDGGGKPAPAPVRPAAGPEAGTATGRLPSSPDTPDPSPSPSASQPRPDPRTPPAPRN